MSSYAQPLVVARRRELERGRVGHELGDGGRVEAAGRVVAEHDARAVPELGEERAAARVRAVRDAELVDERDDGGARAAPADRGRELRRRQIFISQPEALLITTVFYAGGSSYFGQKIKR